MTLIYLGLGSNLGDRKENLEKAIEYLSEKIKILRLSSIYETDPEGFKEQPKFLNMVISTNTKLKPLQLLQFVKNVESVIGRVPTFPNGPRLVDIDILFYDKEIIESHDLTIPHRGLVSRAFVLVPMAEIAPDFVHPGNRKSIKSLLAELGKMEGVKKLENGKK